MKDRVRAWLPWLFYGVAALSRWPGLMPPNFSAVYALFFCTGAFFGRDGGWRLPLGFLVASDLALDLWYQFGKGYEVVSGPGLLYHACTYLGYGGLFLLGRCLRGSTSGPAGWVRAVAGSVLGAALFYFITNTASWLINPFHNPEYVKTLAGWVRALTRGVGGWPETWTFFRNSLLSAALFSGLFAASWQASAGESPAEKGEFAEGPAEAEPEGAEA